MSRCIFVLSWLRHVACGILVPQPGIKPTPPAVEARSLNHRTTREVPRLCIQLQRHVLYCLHGLNVVIKWHIAFRIYFYCLFTIITSNSLLLIISLRLIASLQYKTAEYIRAKETQ